MAYTISNQSVAGGVSPSVNSHTVVMPTNAGTPNPGRLRVRNLDSAYPLRVSRSNVNADGGLLVLPGEVLELYIQPQYPAVSNQFWFFTDKPTGVVEFEVSS